MKTDQFHGLRPKYRLLSKKVELALELLMKLLLYFINYISDMEVEKAMNEAHIERRKESIKGTDQEQ